MQHPDEGTIHAWLDGEVAAEESAALEAHIADCQECSAKVAEARGLIAASSRIVSALDIVPGGVIPAAKPGRHAWYATTQFRAAAAILIVAGASALVMRNGGKRAMQDAVTMSAPVAKESAAAAKPLSEPPVLAASPTQASARDETRNAAEKSGSARQRSLKPEAAPMPKISASANEARAERDFSARETAADAAAGSAAGAAVAAAPPPMPVAALRRAIEPEFRKSRVDSLGASTYTVFKTRDSVEVTLIDAAPVQMQAQRAAPQKILDAPASVTVTGAAAPQAKSRAESQPQIFTLTWIDKRGHRMTLRGPVALTILEQIRSTLPPDQR